MKSQRLRLSKLSLSRCFGRLCGVASTAIASVVIVPPAAAVNIVSQSGISYTGAISATPIGDVVGMTSNSAFPVGTTLGDFAFRGVISVGTDLWLLPTDASEIVSVNSSTGTMTGYPLIGVGTTVNKFAGGVFDGTFIWLVPFNANGVLRVRVADGGGGLKGDVALFDGFPSGVASGDAAKFAGGVFANGSVWFVPHNADRVVRLNPADGTMTGFNGWPGTFTKGAGAFWGGVFDNSKIWLVPFDADRVVKVDPADGSMTEVATSRWTSDLTNFTLPSRAFAGGTWDGSRVWLTPYDADRVVSINTTTDALTGYGSVDDATQWPAGFTKGATGASFNGGLFDGTSIWLVPFEADHAVKVNASTGTMLGYSNFPSAVTASDPDKFAGIGFDGTDLYFGPATRSGKTLVKLFTTATPVVSSVNRLTPSGATTNADSVTFRVTFNKSVVGVDTTDFTLTTTGTVSANIDSVSSGSGTTIDVTVDTITGDGTLRLDVNASGTGITDDFSNALSGGFATGQTYSIDNTAPVVTSSTTASGTYKTSFSYTITASGSPVSFGASGLPAGLSVDSGSGAITGTPTGTSVSSVTISATDAAGNVGSTTLTLTIAAAQISVTGITASDKTYDGTTSASISTVGASFDGVETGDDVTLNTGSATGAFATAGVGTGKTVTISGLVLQGADAGNYALSPTTTTATIESRTLTVTGVSANSRVYDGTAIATLNLGSAALSGVIGGDTVVLNTGSVAGTFFNKNVGVGKTVSVSGLTISGSSSGNYILTDPTTTATVTVKTLTVTGVIASNRAYDGTTTATLTTSGAALVGVESGDDVALSVGSASASFATAAVGAGKAVTITGLGLSGGDATNYTLTQPAATASITAKALTVTGATASDKVYDATTTASAAFGSATLVGVVGSETVTLDVGSASAAFANANAGAGKSVAVSGLAIGGADSGNYSLNQPTLTASITAKVLTVTGVTANNKVYNRSLAATVDTSGGVLVGVIPGDTVTLNAGGVSASFTTIAVGTGKTVTVSGLSLAGAHAANYSLTQPTATANITVATLTVAGVTANNKVYDAGTAATLSTGSAALVGVFSGDVVTPDTSAASASFATKVVGTGKAVTISGINVAGADASNYTLTQPAGTANITAATLAVTGITAANKVYDAGTVATLSTGSASLSGVLGGDTVVLDVSSAAGAFATKAVGTAKVVSVSGLSIGGADAANYALTQPATTANITVATLTVSGVSASDKTYDGNTTATLSTSLAGLVGVLGGDTVTLGASGGSGSFADKLIGTSKTVTVTGLALSGADAANYTLTQPTVSANITAKALTVSGVTGSNKVYDTTTTATLSIGSATLVGVVSGDTVTLDTTGVAGAFATAAVGAGKAVTISGLTISGADAANYTLTQPSTSASITPVALTVSGVTASNKVYDGSTAATLSTGGATLVGVLGSDVVTLDVGSAAGAFAAKAIGTAKTVSVSGLALAGAGASNYTLTQPTTTADITAKPLTVTGVTASNKGFDNSTTASINTSGAALVGVVSGDTVTLDASGASGTFASAAVGTGKVVTVAGLALAGGDAGNYTLTQPTTTADITAASATVSLGGLSHTYDGSAKSATATTTPTGLAVTFTYNGSATAPTTAGSYAVVATISDSNYSGNTSGTLTIAKASAAIVISNTSQVFNGAPRPVTVTTTPSGLAVTTTYDGDTVVPSAIGTYVVVSMITDANYSGSASGTLTVGPSSRLVNVAARSKITTGDNILISGFVVTGSAPKQMLVRGIGPKLADFGVTGNLVTPQLTIYLGGTPIGTNAGWSTASNAAQIESTSATLGAFALPANSKDCAILMTLNPGAYTVHLAGVSGTEGVGLIEVYDAEISSASSRLVNVSARAAVGVGADILIPGFVIEPSGARKILIRVLGPRLGAAGVSGALADPIVRLFSGGTELDANDDWGTEANAAEITSISAQLGSLALGSGSKDAALLVTLEPGAYTVQISGVGGTTGIALVEIFEVQ